jgi:ferric-dicitrate binding protein FerR (iron transport regulator)
MSLPKERIYYLLGAYTSKQASAAEEAELMDWVREAGEDSELKSYMQAIWEQYKPVEDLSYVDWKGIYAHVMQPSVVSIKPKIRRMNWTRVAAAVMILIALGAGTYLYLTPRAGQTIATLQPREIDIAPPAGNKAVLTLADGTKIQLDSSRNGTLAIQGNIQVIKQSNGQISYAGTAASGISFNTLNVPRGSKPLSLLLADGTQVWLNVGSSMTYPTAFSGSERKVKITGEAYFEVAHNAKMPFMVQHDDVTVRVLGTHFNVNSYEDETAVRITLLEGSVRVTMGDKRQTTVITPGQQAQVSDDIKVLNNVDIDEVMAWKNGKFQFGEKTDIGTIMRQIARWYNVDVEYKGTVNEHFWGSISRDVNVSQVLKILEATGGVKFKVEGNKIIVMPPLSKYS